MLICLMQQIVNQVLLIVSTIYHMGEQRRWHKHDEIIF